LSRVIDEHGRFVGVVSTTDVLETLAESGDGDLRANVLEETLVRDIMTPEPQTIEADADVQEAARRMLYLDVRRLFVEDDGLLIGVLSQTDIVRALAARRV